MTDHRSMGQLEPHTAAFLKNVNDAGGALLDHRDLPGLRASMAELIEAMGPKALPIDRMEPRQILAGDRAIDVRLYWPIDDEAARSGARLPVLVYLHGGGWTHFSAATHDNLARYLCNKARSIVVNVDYRLAPENKFPAGLNDAYDAISWASTNIADVGGDPERIAVAGESAGGNLCAAVCLLAKERGGPKIALQLPICASFTLYRFEEYESWKRLGDGDYLLSRESVTEIKGHYLASPTEEANPLVSPLLAPDVSGLPPALVIAAEFDPLIDEAEAYVLRLRQAGVPVEYKRFEGTVHSFTTLSGAIPLGYVGLDLVAARVAAL
jgi:acetyl esterase